jgi:hypothetical protein
MLLVVVIVVISNISVGQKIIHILIMRFKVASVVNVIFRILRFVHLFISEHLILIK